MHAKFTADEILYATSSHLKSGYIDESKGNIIWNIKELKPGDWFIAIPTQFEDPHDRLCIPLKSTGNYAGKPAGNSDEIGILAKHPGGR